MNKIYFLNKKLYFLFTQYKYIYLFIFRLFYFYLKNIKRNYNK